MEEVTFARLSDNEWGVRIVGRHAVRGERIKVTRKDGRTVPVVIGDLVQSVNGIFFHTIIREGGSS